MRIIAGKYKRRQLVTVPGTDVTRPTSDRVRESVFNIIASELQGAIVVDLFSGSGALGIEALSRGARKVAFVERNATALACIRLNIETLGVPSSDYVVVPADVGAFLAAPVAFLPGGDFAATFAASTDVIFADPPYDTPWYDEAVAKLEASGLCAQQSLAVIEMAQGRELPGVMGSPWELSDERKYGKTRVELWRRGIHAGETE